MLLSMVDDKEDKISESIQKEYPHKSTLLGYHGKLWIKLKINPSSDDDGGGGAREEQEQEEDFAKDQKQPLVSNNNTTRICQVCSKVFRSGKALGGHMRVHFQTHKDVIFSKNLIKSSQQSIIKSKKKRKREVAAADFAKRKDLLNTKKLSSSNYHDKGAAAAAGSINNISPTPLCYICGKNFPSMKSLFGHMRCHPDREWRGIQPPPSAAVMKASSLSSVSDAEPQKTDDDYDDDDQVDSAVADGDQTVDLTKSLGGWSVTAKRGRKAIVENSSSSEEEDEGMRDAVYHLMSLARGGDSSCEAKLVMKKHKVEKFEATNSNPFTCNSENEDIMTKRATPGSKKGKKEEFLADHPVRELRNEERKVDGIHLDGMIRMGNNTKAVKETYLFAGKLANSVCQWEDNTWPKDYYGDDDESEDSENTGDDQLLINRKNFERANRNVITVKSKKKRKKMKLSDLDSVHDDDASPVHDQLNRVLALTTSEKYRCTTCNKCFPTHQALGGHRSSHNKIKMAIQNSFGESTTSPAGENESENENFGNDSPITPGVEESKESDDGAASSHQCKICNRNFPTGQALGGHKRCHWPVGQVEGPSSQVTSLVSHTGCRVMEFDLNEVPPLEEDAGIESDPAAGYGCASSSFNSVGFPGFGA